VIDEATDGPTAAAGVHVGALVTQVGEQVINNADALIAAVPDSLSTSTAP
jgi:hypothetical protein